MYDMKNPIKKLATLTGKKRYIFLAFLAVEALSLPAAATQIAQHVSFKPRPVVTAVEIPSSESGVSRYIVASNAGFGVEAIDFKGDVSVEVYANGTLKGSQKFGTAAQLPGPETECAIASGHGKNIYIAERKTAAAKGTAPEQAVIFEFRYDAEANPKFNFVPGTDLSSPIEPCSKAGA